MQSQKDSPFVCNGNPRGKNSDSEHNFADTNHSQHLNSQSELDTSARLNRTDNWAARVGTMINQHRTVFNSNTENIADSLIRKAYHSDERCHVLLDGVVVEYLAEEQDRWCTQLGAAVFQCIEDRIEQSCRHENCDRTEEIVRAIRSVTGR